MPQAPAPAASTRPEAGTAPLPTLPTVVVSTPQGGTPLFEVPGSIDRVDATQLRDSRLQVNLSESLGVVPGLQALDRQNYAQDLQISIRGFGARSTFGLRGIRLYVDGIPATLPDGQGQSSNIDLGSADRIEVLRGPFSALYGNASGGVIQVFTEDGQGAPRVEASMAGASFGGWRAGLKASGSTEPIDYVLSTSRFHTDGWREHAAATRDIANGKLGIALADDARLTLVANSVRIGAQDPLGLTLAQVEAAPRSAPLATQYDTRKTVDQTQAGLVYDRPLGGGHALRLMAYAGERATTQFQSIPPAAQANPLQAGGVIDLSRRYAGFDARWLWRTSLAGGPFDLTAGLAHDSLQESRRGYENFVGGSASPLLGAQGRLRRNERNEVSNIDPYLQARWQFLPRWTLEAGLRHSSVRFESQDRYLIGRNGDDSGSARYRQALPVGSLRYAASDGLSLYATAGRGFETPTLNELSYRSDGRAGLNFALRPATNDSIEVGAKARLAGGLLTAAAFRTGTRDEIVTATNLDGRATFQNAGRTRREGFELGWQHETAGHWRTQLAYTWIDARYRDGFCAVPCAPGAAVPEGSRIPGIARQALFASFGYAPSEGFRAGVEVRARSGIGANDLGTAVAPGHAVLALQAAYALRWSRWTLDAFARVDNLLDRREIGSVIVNEGNGRYFEPAPGRNWTVGAQAAYRF